MPTFAKTLTCTALCCLFVKGAQGKQNKPDTFEDDIRRRLGPVCSFEGKWLFRMRQTSKTCKADLEKTKSTIKFARGVTRYDDGTGTTFEVNGTGSYGDVCTFEVKETIFNAVAGTGWTDDYVYKIRQRGPLVVGEGYYTNDMDDCKINFELIGSKLQG